MAIANTSYSQFASPAHDLIELHGEISFSQLLRACLAIAGIDLKKKAKPKHVLRRCRRSLGKELNRLDAASEIVLRQPGEFDIVLPPDVGRIEPLFSSFYHHASHFDPVQLGHLVFCQLQYAINGLIPAGEHKTQLCCSLESPAAKKNLVGAQSSDGIGVMYLHLTELWVQRLCNPHDELDYSYVLTYFPLRRPQCEQPISRGRFKHAQTFYSVCMPFGHPFFDETTERAVEYLESAWAHLHRPSQRRGLELWGPLLTREMPQDV